MNKKLNIKELESFLNVTDNIINDLVRKGNINNSTYVNQPEIGKKLNKLHSYRKKIIELIEEKLDETFNTEN